MSRFSLAVKSWTLNARPPFPACIIPTNSLQSRMLCPNRLSTGLALAFSLSLVSPPLHADSVDELIARKGKLIFQDKFDRKESDDSSRPSHARCA